MERRLGRGKTFDQVLLSAPVGAVELRVGAVVDDHVRVEVLPADGVRDASTSLEVSTQFFGSLIAKIITAIAKTVTATECIGDC